MASFGSYSDHRGFCHPESVFCRLARSEEPCDPDELLGRFDGGSAVLAWVWWRTFPGLVFALCDSYHLPPELGLLRGIGSGCSMAEASKDA